MNFCTFSHFLAAIFQELATLSCILQKNDLIFPQAVSELRKKVAALEAMKGRPKQSGMLSKFLTCLQGQEKDKVTFHVC